MPKKSTISQARYDQAHCRTYGLKLNTGTDADIIEKLASVPSMQGYIKALVRADINGSVPESTPDNKPVSVSVPEAKEEDKTVDNWDYIVSLMDDEIREAVHADLAPCCNSDFLEEYKKRHQEKYGNEFIYI